MLTSHQTWDNTMMGWVVLSEVKLPVPLDTQGRYYLQLALGTCTVQHVFC